MGTWNASINGNDTAQDLKSEYQAAFFYNDVETALAKLMRMYAACLMNPMKKNGAAITIPSQNSCGNTVFSLKMCVPALLI